MSNKVNWRWVLFALFALGVSGWALLSLAPLEAGTPLRPGPAHAPRFVACVLLAVGGLVLIRAAFAIGVAPARQVAWPWRLALIVPLLVVILLEDIVALLPQAPGAAAIAAWLQDLALMAGPADILAMLAFRWLLAIVVGVIAAGEGALTGLASLLAGAVIGLSGTDLMSGETRLPEFDSLLEEFPYWIEGGVLGLLLACRVNPLPAIFGYVGARAAEEMFRRTMLLTRGDPLQAVPGRPIVLTVLLITVPVALALAWYRWPWRRSGRAGRANPA